MQTILASQFNMVLVATDANQTITDWNAGIKGLFDYTAQEVTGNPLRQLIPGLPHAPLNPNAPLELVGRKKDGSAFPVELAFAARPDGKPGFIVIVRDITQRKRLEGIHNALRHCNNAIVLCQSEAELFDTICRTAVEFGGMTMAWIGMVDKMTTMVTPTAMFGNNTGYIRDILVSSNTTHAFGGGPTGIALRTGEPVWCQDFLKNPTTAPWHEAARRVGIAASASLPLLRGGRVVGNLTVYSGVTNFFDEKIRTLLIEMAQDISFALGTFDRKAEIQEYITRLKERELSFVKLASNMGEQRDPYTAGHERRVASIAVAIGKEMGLGEDQLEGLSVAGLLHDVGKISLPAEILSKPTKLSEAEFQLVKGHAQAGYDILKDVDFPWPVAEVAWQHHERWDGTGYPRGLKGTEITLYARIIAIADVIEAMASHRPYRAGLGLKAALAEISRGHGTAYDPEIADAALRVCRREDFGLDPQLPKKTPRLPLQRRPLHFRQVRNPLLSQP